MGSGKEQQLNQHIEQTLKRWQLLNEKYNRLSGQYHLETRVEEKMRLEPLIAATKSERDQVEIELSELGIELSPNYPDAETQDLSEALEIAYESYAITRSEGGDVTAIQTEIINLKRQIREGGQLKPGDFLLDDRFKLIEIIGRGGFATVWKGYDKNRRQLVAIKVLHNQYAEDRTRRERFFRGARYMASLHHQNIVRVFDEQLEDGGYHFFVMEYVSGDDLRRAVLNEALSLDQRLQIILEVGKALQYAHEKDIVHRDVKPANILLDEMHRPKLTDFDLVRAFDTTGGTRTGFLGTVVYAAPEMMENAAEAGIPADVFGLGMTAIFVLYGKDLPLGILRDSSTFIADLKVSINIRETLEKAVIWEADGRYSLITKFCRALHGPEDRLPDLEITQQEKSEQPEMVQIPAGSFVMGSQFDDEAPPHEVTISEFRIARYPVTRQLYREIIKQVPEQWQEDKNDGQLPANYINWFAAINFCNVLSEFRGFTPCYRVSDRQVKWQLDADGYRLPTEAEWEYAVRARTTTRWFCGDNKKSLTDYAWFGRNSEGRVHPVGKKQANPWELHDMAGNVWEWCWDWLELYPSLYENVDKVINPIGPNNGDVRVLRGGSYWEGASGLGSTFRYGSQPENQDNEIGFRVVRGPRPRGSDDSQTY